jgi:hypothetical protein
MKENKIEKAIGYIFICLALYTGLLVYKILLNQIL